MKIMSKARIAAALAAMAAAGAPVLAADPGMMTEYVRVNRAAVTPATPGEAKRSLGRLDVAAMQACGASVFSVPDYKSAVRDSSCWHDSMTDVVSRIDNQYLTAAYRNHRGMVEVADAQGGSATHAR